MNNVLILNRTTRRNIALLAWAPVVAFAICIIYYLAAISPLFGNVHEPGSVMNYTLANYNTMTLLLSIASILAAAALIYNLVLLARIKHLNSATKLLWMVILATFAPVSAVFFYYFLIKKEPTYVPTHPKVV